MWPDEVLQFFTFQFHPLLLLPTLATQTGTHDWYIRRMASILHLSIYLCCNSSNSCCGFTNKNICRVPFWTLPSTLLPCRVTDSPLRCFFGFQIHFLKEPHSTEILNQEQGTKRVVQIRVCTSNFCYRGSGSLGSDECKV
jgi:hypothetical protein